MSGNIYSDLKSAWWLLKDGKVADAPKQMQLILSDLCNQNCGFCAYRMDGYSSNELFTVGVEVAGYGHNNPKRWLPRDRALRLLVEAEKAGILAIQFTGGGEPTVHPDHEEIFRAALGLGFKCALVSNGLRWSDSLIPMLRQFSWVRVSVDAGTEATYAKIRETPTKNFGKVWNNVERLAHEIRTGTTSDCILGIGYVVTPDNWEEIGLGVARAADSGAAYIRLSAMFSQEGTKPYTGIYDKVRASIHKARERFESASFKVHDLFGDRIQDLEQGNPDYRTCYYQRANTYVGGDLNVYRCCQLSYNTRGLLGSIKDRTYNEFLADPVTQEKFDKFDARGCERCQFNGRNRVMNYLMSEHPDHVEFP